MKVTHRPTTFHPRQHTPVQLHRGAAATPLTGCFPSQQSAVPHGSACQRHASEMHLHGRKELQGTTGPSSRTLQIVVHSG
ncbi:hypothetical protein HaLaN_10722 [Haematococcus lacustris]|uniref:Uncharacterized protein n=1 Tax=Haematococcus lacustris TaxID=44745 RepID=A0A699YWK9_HAELA|nr:hypothetical protein HaLaN_10722 [Haematococcus lacustris]